MTPQEEKEINESMKEPRKLTIKDRKKSQPKAVLFLTDAERITIKNTVAKDLTEAQYTVFIYTAQALGLNPILGEIHAIIYAGKMSIQVARDGFLTIAHRSKKFAGLESGIYDPGDKNPYGKEIKTVTAWAKAYNKDFIVPVYQEAENVEYNTGKNVWATKPHTMLKKVAESMALRKAFNINGVYAPEEMEKEIFVAEKPSIQLSDEQANKPATEAQLSVIRQLIPDEEKASLDEMNITFLEAANKIQSLTKKK